MAKRANIREVAKVAGVSVATVSGVLNHSNRHSPSTAAHLRNVMHEMGYVPRRNRLRRKVEEPGEGIQSLGVLFPDTHRHGANTLLARRLTEGVLDALSEQQIAVTIHTLDEQGNLPAAIKNGELQGLVVRSGSNTLSDAEIHRELEEIGIPTIWTFGGTSVNHKVDLVRMDDRGFGLLAAEKVAPDYKGAVFIIKHSGPINIDFEIRCAAFAAQLNIMGSAEPPTIVESDTALQSIENIRHPQDLTFFVPGHDEQIRYVHKQLSPVALKKGHRVKLIAVMTDDTPIEPLEGEEIQVLHIDPYRIGIAAGRQLLWRCQSPWSEPSKLLISPHDI